MNLNYGSRGDEVRRLQTALNEQGYGLAVDGVYGPKTQSAVRDYQSKHSLQVDGIFGPLTSASLYGSGQSAARKPILSGLTEATNEALQQPPTVSNSVENARKELETVQNAAPARPDSTEFDRLYAEIRERTPFDYRLEDDPLYAQYEAMYTRWGRQVMEDTMGEAAHLTGGYGSTYAETAAQQAYGDWMGRLAAETPAFYDRALAAYEAEGASLDRQLAAAKDRYAMDQASYADWQSQVSDAREAVRDAEQLQFEEYSRLLDYWLQRAKLEQEDHRWQQEFSLKQLGY